MATKSKKEINQELRALDQDAQAQQEVGDLKRPQLETSDAGTRQKIAKQFVGAYFLLLAVLILGIPTYNLIAFKITGGDKLLQISLSDIIQTYSAVVGPTLGFVVAYYFKSKNEQ